MIFSDIYNKIIAQTDQLYFPVDQQVIVVKRFIWGIFVISVSGIIVTLFTSNNITMTYVLTLIAALQIVMCFVSLFLLRSNRAREATVIMSASLYAAITGMITPYGPGGSSVITLVFVIPLVLLSYIWGAFGVFVSFALTITSYFFLFFLDGLGLTGWAATQEKVVWVDFGLQLMIFALIAVVIIQSQRSVISVNFRLYQAQQKLQRFTAGIAHDLGTPLQTLYAQARFLDDVQREIAFEQLELMRAFIEQTRDFLQYQKGVFHLQQEPVPIISVVANAMAAVSTAQTVYRRISISLSCDPSLKDPLVLGDTLAVRRIIDNLLKNAVGVADPESIVTVNIRKIDTYIEIAVVDKGPGIPYEDQPNIFEAYWSSTNGARHTGTGWGLGLAIVRELTMAMGGECGFISTPRSDSTKSGSGSTFWVRLKQCEPF